MISPLKAGEFLTRLAKADGKALDQLQILKLVYMSHGWHLAEHDTPLISERVQAWQYGPVIPSLYHALKRFGTGLVPENWLSNFLFSGDDPSPEESRSLASIYKVYGHFSGGALSNLTHKPGSPWSQVWTPGVKNLVIPNELIKTHYRDAKKVGILASA